jgi:hypothetical protein
MAHFMGVGGAAKLIVNAEDNPRASGARLFPNAAAANRSIFYDGSGRERSVSEVYSVLTQRYAAAAASPATRNAIASVGDVKAGPVLAGATPTIDNATYLSTFPDVRAAAPVTLASASTTANAAPAEAMFRSLYQAGDRTQPLSQAVRELWGNNASLTADPPPPSSVGGALASSSQELPSKPAGGRRLDLFSDPNGTFSG